MSVKKQGVRISTELIWLRIGCSSGLFEHGNEHSVSIKCERNLLNI
jgi:hypothetical protein